MPTPFVIRPAVFDDAHAIARAHVRTWQTTYGYVLPPEFLNSLSVERRTETWQHYLQNAHPQNYLYVAEVEGQVVGFVSFGVKREAYPDYDCELYAIYLLAEHQGQGIGRALVCAAADRLIAEGFSKMYVWVLERNPAIRFYEAVGGVQFDQRPIDIAGTVITEYAYGYADLRRLL